MPRNDQITRQWHLLRQLDGSQGRTLEDLVDNVPEDYPKNARTVRCGNPSRKLFMSDQCWLRGAHVAG